MYAEGVSCHINISLQIALAVGVAYRIGMIVYLCMVYGKLHVKFHFSNLNCYQDIDVHTDRETELAKLTWLLMLS